MIINSLSFSDTLIRMWQGTGVSQSNVYNYVMIGVALCLLYLAIGRNFEPLLLVPIGFGMLLINIPGAAEVLKNVTPGEEGLLTIVGYGVDKVIYPPLIFLGVGAMIDFGPLIANPKSLLIGLGAQLGIFFTFSMAILFGQGGNIGAAISMISSADGPTTVFMATKLVTDDNLKASIIIAAYSYMALIPIIQPPVMKLLTTKKERLIRMKQLREVSKKEKIFFPIIITLVCGLIATPALPLMGMLMLGNLLRECEVTKKLADTASASMLNILTILLGIVVGSKAEGRQFLSTNTLLVMGLGLAAFVICTAGGILTVKLINLFSKEKMNPLIGSAGVSAMPMASRVSQKVGQKYDPENFLLMHAMGPNVAGTIATTIVAGMFLAVLV